MRIVQGFRSIPPDLRPAAVALGVFDGVHVGHRALLDLAVREARTRRLAAMALTFDPHPMEIVAPARAPLPLTTLQERLALLAAAGLDGTIVVPFTADMAAMEAEAFVKDVLVEHVGARIVVVGFNHRFGRGARGDVGLLTELGRHLDLRTEIVGPVLVDGAAVSSSEIRARLQRGDLAGASRMLGRSYAVPGTVVHGAGRGRTLGYPTANIAPARPALVGAGVYACHADVAGGHHAAVVNVGVRPTFGERALTIEAHVLDFSGNLYGHAIVLTFVAHLRDERGFPSVDALREQIQADVAAARRLL